MSDIIQAVARWKQREMENELAEASAKLVEQANTITSLRAEVEEWRHAASEWRSDLAGCVDRETALRSEVERLRAALREIAEYTHLEAGRTARAALEGK